MSLAEKLFTGSMRGDNKTSNQTSLNAANDALVSLAEYLLQTRNASVFGNLTTLELRTDMINAVIGVMKLPAMNATRGGNNSVIVPMTIPGSQTTVYLSLDGSGNVAILTVAQLDRSYVRNMMNGSVTSPINSVIDKIISDIISVKVTIQNGSSGGQVTVPSFVTNISMDTSDIPRSVAVFHYNCTIGTVEKVSFVCPESRVVMNLTCSGFASANVRRKCPVPKQVCNLLNMNDLSVASDEYCQAEQTSSGYLTCKCGFGNNGVNGSAVNAAIIASGGVVNVAVMTEFVAGDFGTTVSIAGSMSSSAFAQQSSAVFIVFGSLWWYVFHDWKY